jgi:hypothetical protein
VAPTRSFRKVSPISSFHELRDATLKYPIIPEDYEIAEKSEVKVYEISNANSVYYRRLWTHNFSGSSTGSHNYAEWWMGISAEYLAITR